jgi:hypothetical protein
MKANQPYDDPPISADLAQIIHRRERIRWQHMPKAQCACQQLGLHPPSA